MTDLTAEQQHVMDRMRSHARELAATITEAETAGIEPAILLPELITVLRDAGFPIPTGLPTGMLARLFG